MQRSTNCGEPGTGAANTRSGTITVLSGCMFSGKTTELLRRLDQLPQGSALVFKHIIDNRYDPDAVVSHAGKAIAAVRISSAAEIPAHVHDGITTVAVDEGHFFDGGLVDVAQALAARGVNVIVTSLDMDSWGRSFPVIEQLRKVSDDDDVLQTTCARCGARADHTQRRTPIVDGDLVGGPESYEARCQRCWIPPPESPPLLWP